jgi:hypothetical protein
VDNSQPKKRFPLRRVARLTFRALALATLMALVVGWAVSYRKLLTAGFHSRANWQFALISYPGQLKVYFLNLNVLPFGMPLTVKHGWHWSAHLYEPPFDISTFSRFKPFELRISASVYERFCIAVPYWFLTILAALAAALSFKRTWRFTTRELLLATTAAALFLGAVIWSMRD